MPVQIKRAYEKADQSDGLRVLVDRIWPRGVSKEDAQIDYWAKPVAPSDDLRKWFGHDPDKFQAFKKKYKEELKNGEQKDSLQELKELNKEQHKNLTLVYASTTEQNNKDVDLKEIFNYQSYDIFLLLYIDRLAQ